MNISQTNNALKMLFDLKTTEWVDMHTDDSDALAELRDMVKDLGLTLKEELNQDGHALIVSVYNDGELILETSFRKPGYKVLVAKVSFELREVEVEKEALAIDAVRQSLPDSNPNELFLAKAYNPNLVVTGLDDIDLRTELQSPGSWEEV